MDAWRACVLSLFVFVAQMTERMCVCVCVCVCVCTRVHVDCMYARLNWFNLLCSIVAPVSVNKPVNEIKTELIEKLSVCVCVCVCVCI